MDELADISSFLGNVAGGSGLTLLVLLCAYLIGSIPTAYLAARYLRGFDIRQRGSGQVGGSNIWHSVSRKVGVVVAVVDIAKGLVAVTGARLLGLDLDGQVFAGVLVVCGHNWSIFLGFSGGRGIATLGGVILLLAPRETGVFALFSLLGLAVKAAPVGVLFGVAALPVSARLLGEPGVLVVGLFLLLLIVVVKRIVPKRHWPRGNWKKVVVYRLLFDRDVKSREAWIKQAGREEPALHQTSKAGDGRSEETTL